MAVATKIEGFSIIPDVCGVGQQVAVRAYLRTAYGAGVPGRKLRFIDYTAGKVLWEQPTASDGYMGRYWYPEKGQLGSHEYFLHFPGDSEHDGSSSWAIVVAVMEVKYEFVIGKPIVRLA